MVEHFRGFFVSDIWFRAFLGINADLKIAILFKRDTN
jgi:hypothetical protein